MVTTLELKMLARLLVKVGLVVTILDLISLLLARAGSEVTTVVLLSLVPLDRL